MGRMSRDKGARFERTVAALFRDHGYEARRSAQYAGGTSESADVIGCPGISIECKAVERMTLYDWMEQAVRDAEASGKGALPVVIHKQNNKPVLCTMRWDDWIQLYKEWEASQGIQNTKNQPVSD